MKIPVPQIKPAKSGHGKPLIASTVALVEAVNSGTDPPFI